MLTGVEPYFAVAKPWYRLGYSQHERKDGFSTFAIETALGSMGTSTLLPPPL
jgi:hypothetical protein